MQQRRRGRRAGGRSNRKVVNDDRTGTVLSPADATTSSSSASPSSVAERRSAAHDDRRPPPHLVANSTILLAPGDTERAAKQSVDELFADESERSSEDDSRWLEMIESSGFFGKLPDEVLVEGVFPFLDIQSVCLFARTCRRLDCLAGDVPMLKAHARRGRWVEMLGQSPSESQLSRAFYKRLYQSFRRGEREKKRRAKEARRSRRFRDMRQCAIVGYGLLFSRLCEIASFLIIFITSVRVAQLADRQTAVTVLLEGDLLPVLGLDEDAAPVLATDDDWRHLLGPLMLPALQLLLGAPLFVLIRQCCFAERYHYFGPDQDFSSDLEDGLSPTHSNTLECCRFCGPSYFYVLFVYPWKREAALPACLATTLLGLSLVLACLHLTGSAVPWVAPGAALASLLVVASVYAWVGRYWEMNGSIFSASRWVERSVAPLVFLGIATGVMFISLKLDGVVTWSWYVVMAPLWAVKGLTVFLTLLFSCLSSPCMPTSSCMYDASHFNKYDEWTLSLIMSTGVHAFVVLPLFLAELLSAFTLEGYQYYTWGSILAPFYILESIFLCGCLLTNVFIIGEM